MEAADMLMPFPPSSFRPRKSDPCCSEFVIAIPLLCPLPSVHAVVQALITRGLVTGLTLGKVQGSHRWLLLPPSRQANFRHSEQQKALLITSSLMSSWPPVGVLCVLCWMPTARSRIIPRDGGGCGSHGSAGAKGLRRAAGSRWLLMLWI